MMLYQRILEELENSDEVLTADGLDQALVGTDDKGRAVYATGLCELVLMQRDGMSQESAREFLAFNTYGAHVGDMTPVWVDFQDDVLEFLAKANGLR